MNILETVVFAEGEEMATNAGTTNTSTQQVPAEQQPNPVMSALVSFLPLVLVIALLYFMMIRPQRKKEKEAKEMINALKVGDKVVTIGGIYGKISKIKDDYVIMETGNIGTQDEKSFIKMERDSIKTVEQKKSN